MVALIKGMVLADEQASAIHAGMIAGSPGDDVFYFNSQADVVPGGHYSGGGGYDTVQLDVDALDLRGVTFDADIERLYGGNYGVTVAASQLSGFTTIQTGAITIADAGTADLSGDTVYTNTFNLAVGGITLNMAGAGGAYYTINGSSGTDTVTGGVSNDTIYGNGGNDTLNGGGGDDNIYGGAGLDTINGGAGSDTFHFGAQTDLSTGAVKSGDVATAVTFGGEHYTGGDADGAGYDTVQLDADGLDLRGAFFDADIERFYGGNYSVTVAASQLSGFTTVQTGAITIATAGTADLSGDTVYTSTFNLTVGGITLNMAGAGGAYYTVNGSGGVDVVIGGGSNDTIYGNGGNDTLNGNAGDDNITGGAGADQINGGAGADTFHLTAQADVAAGEHYTGGDAEGAGYDTVELDADGLDLTGITFDADIERFYGGNYSATVAATQLSGFTTIQTGAITIGQAGTADLSGDTVYTSTFNLAVGGITLNMAGAGGAYYTINGSGGADVVTGGGSNDTIYGNGGNDTLNGNTGDDNITGGAGADQINGGAGADTFHLTAQSDVAAGEHYTGGDADGAGYDTVELDADGLDLTGIIFDGDVDRFYGGNYSVTVAASQLTGFTTIQTGAITIATAGTADLSGDTVYTSTFNLTVGGVTLNMAGAGGAYYTINGSGGADIVIGGASNDTIYGNGGEDTLNGNTGDDNITGGAGADQINGGAGADTFHITAQADVAVGEHYTGGDAEGAGNDTVELDANGLDLNGIAFDADIERLYGGNFAVTVGAGQLSGFTTIQTGAITINQAGVADLSGDTVYTNTFNLAVSGVTLNLADAGGAYYTVNGSKGRDIVTGGASNDTIYGNGGNDTLSGGRGDDTLDGGAGTDTASYADASGGVSVSLANTSRQYTGAAGADLLISIENLTGSDANDALTGDQFDNVLSGGLGDDVLSGGLGDDRLIGGAGSDTASYADASAGVTVDLSLAVAQDTVGAGMDTLSSIENLIGSDHADTLTGSRVANRLDGGAGADIMTGGLGNDTYVVDDASDQVHESAGGGIDSVETSLASYVLGAEVENLTFVGNGTFAGTGNTLANVINGGAGNDDLTGQGGNDILIGGAGNDMLDGGSEIDTASYATAGAAVTVSLGTAQPQDTGGAGTDTLLNIESLTGSRFDDSLSGDNGANVLIGGAGGDMLTGGGGADRFSFTALDDFGTTTLDHILDFSHVQRDKIVLNAIDPDPALAGNQKFTFIGEVAFSGGSSTNYELRVADNHDGSFTVQGDVDHDGVADFALLVTASQALVASDFIL